MLKTFSLLRRRPDMSHDEFMRYMYKTHVPLAKKIPGLKKYVTYEILRDKGAESEPEWDSISELWFENKETWDKGMASPQGETSLADARTFIEGVVTYFVDAKQQL